MPGTFFVGQEIIEIDETQLDQLKQTALNAPLKRARLCLHQDHSDKVQEMIIAFCQDSYVRPHRHTNKCESFHVIEGELSVFIFNNKGQVIQRINMGPFGGGQTFLYRLSTDLWHSVVPLSEFVIIHETNTGPFVDGETEFANWGPDETNAEGIKSFLEGLAFSGL